VHARSLGPRGALAFATALVLVLSAWNNVVVTRLSGYPGPTSLPTWQQPAHSWRRRGSAGCCGKTWDSPGVGCPRRPRPPPLLSDARVAGLDGDEFAYQVLVRIPLGTVLWEEVAFRGVLLAAAPSARWPHGFSGSLCRAR
jgi:hypothetical protein